jgi:hypothetical protein
VHDPVSDRARGQGKQPEGGQARRKQRQGSASNSVNFGFGAVGGAIPRGASFSLVWEQNVDYYACKWTETIVQIDIHLINGAHPKTVHYALEKCYKGEHLMDLDLCYRISSKECNSCHVAAQKPPA